MTIRCGMPGFAALVLLGAACPAVSRAGVVAFNVSMNTAPLVGDPAAPFSLEYQFNDGSGTNDGNNSVTLDNFNFGSGGGPVGAPSTTGGVTGDLGTTITLNDTSFFNQFIQQFNPGNALSFRVSLSTNVDPGGAPDEFTFAILDSGSTEIPTLGFFDVFVDISIDSSNPVPVSFGSDTSRNRPAGRQSTCRRLPSRRSPLRLSRRCSY